MNSAGATLYTCSMPLAVASPALLRPALWIWAVALAAALPAAGEELRGRLELAGGGGETAGAVVYFRPAVAVPVSPPRQPYEIVTRDKQFEPRVLALPVGGTVRFPNRDPILHNVFSVSGGNRFDLGLYRRGPGKEVTFREPGVVRVFCNVHHDMVAYVLVLDTPFHTTPAADGSFRLTGLPPGEGTLTVWHERAEPWSRALTLPRREEVAARLEITRPRVPSHRNKFGRAYRRGREYR